MTETSQMSCLVLGERRALDEIEPAIEQAIDLLNLHRLWPPAPDEVLAFVPRVDLIVAEVSKPSPSIAFELGVAAQGGVPALYLARDNARVSPVFGSTEIYTTETPSGVLAFTIAKQLERLIESGRHLPAEQVADHELWSPEYELDEVVAGVVAHVDTDGGYALITVPGRATGLLHVTNMSRALAMEFAQNHVRIGDVVELKVKSIDKARGRTLFTDLLVPEPAMELASSNIVRTARILSCWAQLEPLVQSFEVGKVSPREIVPPEYILPVQEWYQQSEEGLRLLRHERNRITHGELFPELILDEVMVMANELCESLERAWPRGLSVDGEEWASGSPPLPEQRTNAIVMVVEDSDTPVSIDDVFNSLASHGRSEESYQPVVSTLNYLAKNGRIQKVGRGMYAANWWTGPAFVE